MNPFLQSLAAACGLLVLAAPLAYAADRGVEYKVVLDGLDDAVAAKAVKASALTFVLEKRPPATMGQLQRRIDKDLPVIGSILESRGYYDGAVAVRIDSAKDPVRVVLEVAPGKQYRFGQIELGFSDRPDAALAKIKTRLRKNGPAVAELVFDEQRRILDLMQRNGYPFPTLAKRNVDLDRANRRVNLRLDFDPGIYATYGGFEVSGLETLDEKYIRRQLPWKPGDKYDARLVSDFEHRLLSSGIFGTARVEPEFPVNGSNSIPVKITVTERAPRTIRVGAGYSDVGPNAKLIWEHRNLFGSGEHFKTSVAYSPVELLGSASLERPGFILSNQALVLGVDVSRETPDAYDADKVVGSALVKRDFTRHIMGGSGLRYKYSLVEQLLQTDVYNYLVLPVLVDVDYRNDKLNPVNGGQLFLTPSIYKDLDASDVFLKTGVEARLYKMLWDRPRLSGATRLTMGSIAGVAVENIPADERYYAGGGGSIRGYEYQSIGPQLNGTPLGGSELLEFSLEMRMQPGNKLGYVAFVDGGTVYNDLAADSDRTLRFGAGLGLRWFTTIGPLRVDLAYPLNPAPEHVERLQFYISLGQAF